MENVQPHHDLRAAFTRGSEGWIYVETSMNAEVQKLLLRTLAIVRTRSGIVSHPIDINDRSATLTLPRIGSESFSIGQWVRVLQGPYRDDIGLVAQVKATSVRVLLAPRLQSQAGDQTTHGKRKRGSPRPSPALFHPLQFQGSGRFKLKETSAGFYQYGTFNFEHGLILKAYGYQSISYDQLRIPFSLASLFQTSGHPKVNLHTFPVPQEWSFEVGERVKIASGFYKDHRGVISAVAYNRLEIDLSETEGGQVSVPWHSVLKHFPIGSFLTVLEGAEKGRSGWVVNDSETELSFITLAREASLPGLQQQAFKLGITVHQLLMSRFVLGKITTLHFARLKSLS